MSPTIRHEKPNKDADLIALRKALAIERRSRYPDFHGRRSTFSQFMYRTAARLAREYPHEAVWVTIKGLFRQYKHTDAATRIAIVRRADELLGPYWARLKADSAPADVSADEMDAAERDELLSSSADGELEISSESAPGQPGGSGARLTLGLEAAKRAIAQGGGRAAGSGDTRDGAASGVRVQSPGSVGRAGGVQGQNSSVSAGSSKKDGSPRSGAKGQA
ncbi:MAG: hypothetical protein K2Z81_00865, partial [Cyanobacteria bacterium]|nr:hypothetical protein [Cyanobacteriota bacterium]